MRKILFSTFLILSACTSIFSSNKTASPVFIHPDLIYYQFERILINGGMPNCGSPGAGFNQITLSGVTHTAGGQFDSCITGTGIAGGGITTGWNCNFGTSSWTISMWISIPSTNSGSAYYLFGDAGSGTFRCFHNGVAGQDNLVLRGNFTDVNVTGIGPAPAVVTFVYDSAAAQIRVYKNGILSVTSNQSLNIPQGSGFKAGGYSTSLSLYGKMDEFRLYRYALTPAEITSSWNLQMGCWIDPVNNHNSELPAEFEILQNYPNPFNPLTSIKYNIPQLSYVKLSLFDMAGRETAILVNELKQPGRYELLFDGTQFSSGIYMYKIEAGDFSDVKKMVLIK